MLPAAMTAPNIITASTWARDSIIQAFKLGLIPQNLQDNYKSNITRAEFAALTVALYETVTGMEIALTREIAFIDTTDINVQKAAYIDVVKGVGGNRFAPDDGLTREQAAVMLARLAYALDKPLPEADATFADSEQVNLWAIDAVGSVQATGIMDGIGGNKFDPQGDYTREQSIITILRLIY
jgi:hypothetical protein